MSKDDINSDDVVAYQANAGISDEGTDDSSLFGEGGAIMAALQEKDPSLIPKPAPKKKAPEVKKPTKAEIEKKKKEEEAKKKAEEEIKRKAKIAAEIK